MATNAELKAQLAEAEQKLAIEQAVNARLATLVGKQEIQTKAATAKAPAVKRQVGDTYNNEPIVGFVKVGQVRATKSGVGKMVNFNSTGDGKNFLRFVKSEWAKDLKAGAEYPVTEHVSKHSGKTSYAIYLKGVARAVYCAKK